MSRISGLTVGMLVLCCAMLVLIAGCTKSVQPLDTTSIPCSDPTGEKTYVAAGDACNDNTVLCQGETTFFNDTCGCGCAKKRTLPSTNGTSPEGTLTVCTPESRQGEFCTMDYNPVCGWYDESISCIKYPCAQTYSNACQACKKSMVKGWTAGECPK